MIVDSHCHLDFETLYKDLDGVVQRANHNKIKYLLTICTTLHSFEKIKIITDKYKNIYGTFGIHPHETKDHLNIDSQGWWSIVKSINSNQKNDGEISDAGEEYHSDLKILEKKM